MVHYDKKQTLDTVCMQEVIWSTRRRLDDYRGKEEEEDRELLIDKTKDEDDSLTSLCVARNNLRVVFWNKERSRHKALRDC